MSKAMEEVSQNESVETDEVFPVKPPESPKALSFTVDFNDGKNVDTERHKVLVEKFQKKHRRGQSLSKLDEPNANTPTKKHPLTGYLPRKSSFQSEGYFSSDERNDRNKTPTQVNLNRNELSLPLKHINSDKIKTIYSKPPLQKIQLSCISSPDSDLVSPFSPNDSKMYNTKISRQLSNPETTTCKETSEPALDLDKSDDVSDTGTYTLDDTNYSEEQKARMSIDREFKIEQISVTKKTEDYIQSLYEYRRNNDAQLVDESPELTTPIKAKIKSMTQKVTKLLSPILSPTQNLSITENGTSDKQPDGDKNCVKILFPSAQSKIGAGIENYRDQGSVISVTSSGAFRSKSDKDRHNIRRLSLTKSEVHVEAYIDDQLAITKQVSKPKKQLTASVVNVQNIPSKNELSKEVGAKLPPMVGGVSGMTSPSKIPSPIHTLSRSRSRNSLSSLNIDLSDSSLETESYLKPTQNFINSLQQKLTLNSDYDCDYNDEQLNNSPKNMYKHRTAHTRHNSLDDNSSIKISNKLEHFQNKQSIDQTFTNVLKSYTNRTVQKIQNSPNNSPIRRSSSFSTKHGTKNTNLVQGTRPQSYSASIQRSSSSATIKPNIIQRKITGDHKKIDRDQFGETESSSEEDFDKKLSRKKDLSNLTTTRYNRAFSLRRGRLDEQNSLPKCPNTPEMRRKFQPDHLRGERAISMDRKPVKTNEVQSRYMMNVTKKPIVAPTTPNAVKNVPKINGNSSQTKAGGPSKQQPFSRIDGGRFSMKANLNTTFARPTKKEVSSDKKSNNPRSNSSLSCREKEFQNWKRRKSYDPMKAAAEGKRKEIAKKQNMMTQSFHEADQNQDCDSSPSRSSSVHRSQSFHGTAALIQLLSSEEEEDLTLSADEGFSPPTPSPCNVSPSKMTTMPNTLWREHVLH